MLSCLIINLKKLAFKEIIFIYVVWAPFRYVQTC
jgi:hypothetical protein